MNNYWEKRYRNGGNSGPGSYGDKAIYKAHILNSIIEEYKIKSLIDFGCGDGNNLQHYNVEYYTGLDISRTAIKQCVERYQDDSKKSFLYYEPELFKAGGLRADLTISFEVIFHLTDDKTYYKYLKDLLNTTSKYVLIFSSNSNDIKSDYEHIKHREFTKNISPIGFECIEVIETKGKIKNLFSDFYLFERR